MDEVRAGEAGGEEDGQRDIAAAAAVHAAKRELDDAIAELAASPLDRAAADRMRNVLSSPRLRSARGALARLQPSSTPTASPRTASPTQDAPRARLSVVNNHDVSASPNPALSDPPGTAARLTTPATPRATGGIA